MKPNPFSLLNHLTTPVAIVPPRPLTTARRPPCPDAVNRSAPISCGPVKLVTYEAGEGPRAGVVVESGIIDAWRVLGEPLRESLRELIAEGRIDETRTKVFDPGGTVVEPVPHDEATLLPPIP